MMGIIKKITFLKKKPKVVVVGGSIAQIAKSAIVEVLRTFLKVADIKEGLYSLKEIQESQVLISELKEKTKTDRAKFWLRNSSLPILVITDVAGLPKDAIEDLIESLPPFGFLVFNFDNEVMRKIGESSKVFVVSFGFTVQANFSATDCRFSDGGSTFKVNFGGNTLPVWLNGITNRENIYAALCALSVAQILNLNLVGASQALKIWQPPSGDAHP